MHTITLDARIDCFSIVKLAEVLGACNHLPEVCIDLSRVRFFELIPMTLLLGKLMGWVKAGKTVHVTNPDGCRCGPYMQRMNFFSQCGVKFAEEFTRQAPRGRFLEFKAINPGSTAQATNIATSVADVLAPDQVDSTDYDSMGFYDSIEYSVSELVLNVVQHSRGRGYIGAQYYGFRDEVQVAISDTGIGIRESFVSAGSPMVSRMQCDADALKIALENGVSCTAHMPDALKGEGQNAGVGLTFLSELARTTGGSFMLLSGEAANINDNLSSLGTDSRYDGTFTAFSFPRSKLDGFYAAMESVKAKYLDSAVSSDQFDKVFT